MKHKKMLLTACLTAVSLGMVFPGTAFGSTEEKMFYDETGAPLYGWISEDGQALDDTSGDAYLDGVYYCDPDERGAATGWKYLMVKKPEGGMERCWFYFKENGKKAADESITESDENGRYRYKLDENGILCSSKKIAGSSPSHTEQWIERVPTASQDFYANQHGIKRWYYGLSNGKVVTDQLKTIDGKVYLFDSLGIMRTGLIAVTKNRKYYETLICGTDGIDCDADSLEAYLDEYDLMYFDEISGARQTGETEITSYGQKLSFRFEDNGKAVHGSSGGCLYKAGLLQRAEAGSKYEVKTVDGCDYLVNSEGRIQKKGRYRDHGDVVWVVEREDGAYSIFQE